MGQLLRNRRLGCGRPDRIAVRRYDAHCRETSTTCGGGRRRICDADDRSFQQRVAFVSTSKGSMAIDHPRRSSLGPHRPRWISVRDDRSSAHANANRIPTRVRGPVISCSAAFGGVLNARAICIGGSLLHARGPVWRWSCGAAVAFHRNSQRLGQRLLPCICQRAAMSKVAGGAQAQARRIAAPYRNATHRWR